ncbi:xylose isomerase-like TIM barrel domain-containing protein [Hirsutella rhossiliensis]|uniref:Apurinic-apyrimidinic endonuclease 1 n=1 Tax=Hirsutella rhossiliensis TaxID=111463 RepID=A0A9P8MUT3_9HYPO|nr:xylose isomerase-like TIM barrel domain-containing protein [Hirsutella rhossiliensis]KAH0960641.1 xylose isomerase-like TIM barrel domain-containing protein [Hirsutella rhossiliensis]
MARTSSRRKPAVDYSESPATKAEAATSSTTAKATTRVEEPPSKAASKATAKAAAKRKAEPEAVESDSGEVPRAAKRPKAKAKTKAKGDDSMPLAERTAVASLGKAMYIGAHVSAAGGVNNSVTNAMQIGANSFALFLKSQRKWDNPPMSAEARDLFLGGCKDHGYSAAQHALPHGSYLVNLAQSDATKAAQAYKSFVDDLQRCEQLGIGLYNFHPGSTLGDTRPAAIGRIAAQLNSSHRETKTVVTVLENMAGSGNVIGSTWEDLRDIIDLVEDKDRVGVCIDTCHAFAAGYDLRTNEAFKTTMESFEKTVSFKYLKAFHLNDSKAPLGSNRDLHANIGTGFLGLRAFHSIVNDDTFRGMPMVLETPIDRKGADGKTVEDKQIWADEIKLLESLVGMDPEGDDFRAKEAGLQATGAGERSRIQDQVDKKSAKDAKKGSRGAGGKKTQ